MAFGIFSVVNVFCGDNPFTVALYLQEACVSAGEHNGRKGPWCKVLRDYGCLIWLIFFNKKDIYTFLSYFCLFGRIMILVNKSMTD